MQACSLYCSDIFDLKSYVNTVLVLQECDPEEEATTGVAVGILLILEEGVASSAMVRRDNKAADKKSLTSKSPLCSHTPT